VNKNLSTNVQSHHLYFIPLICLNLCYFTWLHICLGNEISVLHILIGSHFREGPNIYKSGGYYSCWRILNWKWSKKGVKKAIRQENGDRVNDSNLVHKNWCTFAHAPRWKYHCILLYRVTSKHQNASCD